MAGNQEGVACSYAFGSDGSYDSSFDFLRRLLHELNRSFIIYSLHTPFCGARYGIYAVILAMPLEISKIYVPIFVKNDIHGVAGSVLDYVRIWYALFDRLVADPDGKARKNPDSQINLELGSYCLRRLHSNLGVISLPSAKSRRNRINANGFSPPFFLVLGSRHPHQPQSPSLLAIFHSYFSLPGSDRTLPISIRIPSLAS